MLLRRAPFCISSFSFTFSDWLAIGVFCLDLWFVLFLFFFNRGWGDTTLVYKQYILQVNVFHITEQQNKKKNKQPKKKSKEKIRSIIKRPNTFDLKYTSSLLTFYGGNGVKCNGRIYKCFIELFWPWDDSKWLVGWAPNQKNKMSDFFPPCFFSSKKVDCSLNSVIVIDCEVKNGIPSGNFI